MRDSRSIHLKAEMETWCQSVFFKIGKDNNSFFVAAAGVDHFPHVARADTPPTKSAAPRTRQMRAKRGREGGRGTRGNGIEDFWHEI